MSDTLTLRGREITVPALTVQQIRELLSDSAAADRDGEIDLLGGVLFEDITLDELQRVTGADRALMEHCTPAELQTLVDKVLEVNPHWAPMRRRIVDFGQRLRLHLGD